MTSYDWPARAGDSRPDDRRGRDAWNAARGLPGRGDLLPDPEPPARGRRGRSVPKAAPSAAADLWQPIGPSAVLGGQAAGTPRVTGRIRDVWVEPTKGLRAYAAAASGGVWYTDDGGGRWRAIGGWRPADPSAPSIAANPLATGCLWVEWGRTGAADDPTKDDVWVGTGEAAPRTEGSPGGRLPGVGILRAAQPWSKPETDPVFVAEATNLVGASVFRLARQPAGGAMAAATSAGLVERPAGAAPQATWSAPDGLPKGPKGAALECTDVVWTPAVGGQKARLWASLRRAGTALTELWVRDDGTTTFTQVTLPAGPAPATAPTTRLNVASSLTGDTVWALGDGPRLWRVDTTTAPLTGVLVSNVPALWGGNSSSQSKIVVAVDPSAPARVALGGTVFGAGASLFLGAVTSPAAGVFRYPAGADVGDEVHPDVLAIRFTPDGSQVWVACDGGVYVSTAAGAKGTFVARNAGLEVVEAGYVASHPVNDTAVLMGAQDNATQRRIGETLWAWERGGDGGGIAWDQVATHRYVAQYIQTDWANGVTTPSTAPVRRGANALWSTEDGIAEFYSMPATVAKGAVNQLAVGTNRVWYTESWGTGWVTLPTATDPRNGPVNNAQDVIATPNGAIRVLKWADSERLWVMQARSLHQLRRVAGTWAPVVNISLEKVFHPAKKTDVKPEDTCNDIAVHDPARGASGSLYLALQGDLKAGGSDQLWWFDGTSTWVKTGLRTKTTASVLAVAVEPGHPDTVYVGTTIGVFRTTVTFAGATPTFAPWTRLDNGLPDVAVQDLSVHSAGPVRLLRAGTQARGVWELDLTGPVADRTFLRVHPYDSRRTSPTSLAAPFEKLVPDPADATKKIPVSYSWHASPDLRVHPRLGAMAAPASTYTQAKPSGTPADPLGFWRLWRFQVALRKVDRRSEPTGRWDAEFDAVLRANGAPVVGGKAVIDKPFWQSIVTAPNLTQLPWDRPTPSEADLVELLPAETTALAIDKPSVTVPLGPLTVHVMLHHRGFPAAGDAQVTLLYRLVPKWQAKKSVDWATGAVGWTAAVSALLSAGTAPGALPAGWHLADPATPRRQPAAAVAAGAPQAVSLDLDVGAGVKKGTLALLVAVVHAGDDPVALSEVPLRQLALDRRHVAVRSVLLR
jgi:hypothetical protein